jgi:DNA-binding transcriptional MerR regulator
MVLSLVFATVQAAETVKQREQREAYQKQLEARLHEVDQKLNRLRGKASDVKDDSRQEYRQKMEELKKKRETAGKKLQELKSAGASDWDRLKMETSFAIDDTNSMYDRMRSYFK